MVRLAGAVLALLASTAFARAGELPPALVPAPLHAVYDARGRCAAGAIRLDRPLRFPRATDAGGFALIRERWTALGIPAPVLAGAAPDIVFARPRLPARSTEHYRLDVGQRVVIAAGEAGTFDALATLAQLPVRRRSGWMLPCAAIDDEPALRWRIVSDDISRGPFPTPDFFRTRIRTLASFKINGWSPYMEQVFFDPAHPEVAFPNALTAAQLHALTLYARRFHVALIPEQQTFAHMHEALKLETLAPLAELPHGYLISPSDAATYAYLDPLLRAEHAAADDPPFFHVGADEPLDLGRGRTPRTPQIFAAHVRRVAAAVAAGGTRAMIWDDAVQADPSILPLLPKATVIVDFHYGAEPSYARYIATVGRAGFAQMVSPGANNWNELYADLGTAYANIAGFVADGKRAGVLGMFATVWHDDGETLYGATWAPLAFAAASAWQAGPVDRATWHTTFARVFFGTDDPRYAADLDALQSARERLRTHPADPVDYLFWADPFERRIAERMDSLDLAALRRDAERVTAHLAVARPPLNRAAAGVMRLAALRYDILGRRYQIAAEVRALYADAVAHAPAHDDAIVYRDLNLTKYLCWELRDEMTDVAPLYARAWDAESTPPGRDRVLTRFAAAAQQALERAGRLDTAAREDYLRAQTLPPFETAIGAP